MKGRRDEGMKGRRDEGQKGSKEGVSEDLTSFVLLKHLENGPKAFFVVVGERKIDPHGATNHKLTLLENLFLA